MGRRQRAWGDKQVPGSAENSNILSDKGGKRKGIDDCMGRGKLQIRILDPGMDRNG